MAQVNFARGEVQCKVVFYGPAQSGKTANLRAIHDRSPEHVRGKLTSIATDGARTLFFDYLPLNLGKVAGIRTKINLYAVPYLDGQNALRLLVLEGADGIVFVADSSRARADENREALDNLRSNLAAVGRDLADVPLVFQWNKTDIGDAMTAEEMAQTLDIANCEAVSSSALAGTGVLVTLKTVTRLVLQRISGMMTVRTLPEETLLANPEQVHAPTRAAGAEEPEDPVFRPAWHRRAPKEDTSTHSGIVAELEHRPLASLRNANQEVTVREPAPTIPDDGPLEIPRQAASRKLEETQPEPPPAIVQRAEELKNQDLDAESAARWQDEPQTDPSMRAEAAGRSFPAFGGGMAPVSPSADDEDGSRLVTVGGGGARGATRTIKQKKNSWDTERTPVSLRPGTGQPAKERRRRPRAQWRAHPPPLSQVAAGVVFALLWLAATGYLVKELL